MAAAQEPPQPGPLVRGRRLVPPRTARLQLPLDRRAGGDRASRSSRSSTGSSSSARAAAARYGELLAGVDGVEPPLADDDDHVRSWFVYVVLLADGIDRDAGDRRELAGAASRRRHYVPCIHLQPYMRERYGFGEGLCPVAEDASAPHARASVLHRDRAGRPGARGRGPRRGALAGAGPATDLVPSRSTYGGRPDVSRAARSRLQRHRRGRRSTPASLAFGTTESKNVMEIYFPSSWARSVRPGSPARRSTSGPGDGSRCSIGFCVLDGSPRSWRRGRRCRLLSTCDAALFARGHVLRLGRG